MKELRVGSATSFLELQKKIVKDINTSFCIAKCGEIQKPKPKKKKTYSDLIRSYSYLIFIIFILFILDQLI
jgi:hypothetical protein